MDASDLDPRGIIDLIQAYTGKAITPGKVFRELFTPPYAIRTSLAPHADGALTKDLPLYAFGMQLPRLLG